MAQKALIEAISIKGDRSINLGWKGEILKAPLIHNAIAKCLEDEFLPSTEFFRKAADEMSLNSNK